MFERKVCPSLRRKACWYWIDMRGTYREKTGPNLENRKALAWKRQVLCAPAWMGVWAGRQGSTSPKICQIYVIRAKKTPA